MLGFPVFLLDSSVTLASFHVWPTMDGSTKVGEQGWSVCVCKGEAVDEITVGLHIYIMKVGC